LHHAEGVAASLIYEGSVQKRSVLPELLSCVVLSVGRLEVRERRTTGMKGEGSPSMNATTLHAACLDLRLSLAPGAQATAVFCRAST